MTNLSDLVEKEYVEKALEYFLTHKVKLNPSTGYDLIHNGVAFPPKEVVRKAAELQGIVNWKNMRLNGGNNTNTPLKEMGFIIKDKKDPIPQLINEYKQRVRKTGNKGELYKWQLLQQFKP
jgi:hypothetical protein